MCPILKSSGKSRSNMNKMVNIVENKDTWNSVLNIRKVKDSDLKISEHILIRFENAKRKFLEAHSEMKKEIERAYETRK